MVGFGRKTVALVLCMVALVHSQTSSEKLSTSANCFTFQFYQELAKDQSSLVCSPFSLDILLSILRTGAGGTTYNQLTKGLGYENLPDSEMENAFQTKMNQFKNADSNTLDIANSVWVEKDNFAVNSAFMETVTDKFNSEVNEVDFRSQASAVTDEINKWGNTKTQGMIPKLFDQSLDPRTVMVLVNAIYFKGTWSFKFNKDNTKPGQFRNKDSSDGATKVQMMHQRAKLMYHDDDNLNAQVLELFYAGNNKSMIILLPNEGTTLAQMEGALNCDTLSNALRSGYSTLVDLTMPKFKFGSDFDLEPAIKGVGMGDIFERTANFSRISPKIFVSKAIQKAVIQVYEEGTTAAVLTGLGMMRMAAAVRPEPEVVVFNADHPFLFFIRDKPTDLILFMGRVNDLPNAA